MEKKTEPKKETAAETAPKKKAGRPKKEAAKETAPEKKVNTPVVEKKEDSKKVAEKATAKKAEPKKSAAKTTSKKSTDKTTAEHCDRHHDGGKSGIRDASQGNNRGFLCGMADEVVSGESERAARKWRGRKVITIRHSVIEDLPQIMEIYGYARSFMAAHGNPNQWGRTNWPPEDLIRSDIVVGKSYVCVLENEIVGTFFYDCGTDIEPTYSEIYDGSWLDASPYGVIHRIAANGIAKGVAHTVIMWAREQCPHLRIDTHGDNLVMQNMLAKEGFSYRGIIYVTEDNDPRLAYEIV